MDVFVPIPPGGGEWVVVEHPRELEKILGAGPRRIPWWQRPIRATHITEDDHEPREQVDAPWMGSHGLVLKPVARVRLQALFGDAVQYVPISGTPYRRLYYAHVHNLVDELDEARSEIVRFSPGPDILDITRHEFLPSVAQAGPIFKLRQMPRGDVYLTGDAVEAIRASGLSGFAFQRVWSSGR